MFRIVCDPSSGSTELCLAEITLSGSQVFFVCLVGVWQGNFEPAVCVYGTTGWEDIEEDIACILKVHAVERWLFDILKYVLN